jgi:hypothetical protein
MSSSANRRFRRKMERDVKKHIKTKQTYLDVPTEQDIQDYINNKLKELKLESNGLQLQETNKS